MRASSGLTMRPIQLDAWVILSLTQVLEIIRYPCFVPQSSTQVNIQWARVSVALEFSRTNQQHCSRAYTPGRRGANCMHVKLPRKSTSPQRLEPSPRWISSTNTYNLCGLTVSMPESPTFRVPTILDPPWEIPDAGLTSTLGLRHYTADGVDL